MGSLDTLTPDQRAVLDLVLKRGRSYDDIARLLAIDRAAVRARALAAFDELGPENEIAAESRALIADYLLGQLPERVAEQTRERLASSPGERAWARVLASELAPVAGEPLPEIPDGSRIRASASGTQAEPAPSGTGRSGDGSIAPPTRKFVGRRAREREPRRKPRLSERPSSRRGGAIMLGVGALLAVAVVVVLIAILSGGSTKHSSAEAAAGGSPAGGSSSATTSSTATTSTTSPQAQVVAQTNLNPPSGAASARGVGFVVRAGTAYGVIIQAQHVPPNNHNAYAAWLYNSANDAYRLGFVNPGVGKNGQLQTGGALPANAGHFKQLLLTLETQANPKSPGMVVLEGPFKGVPASG